ncbi:MAG: hypothetical protein FJ098_02335 [Deltaproteobacteria bacterium]|nr:hypothetical protein [Deltaproteobacteria bacterium]
MRRIAMALSLLPALSVACAPPPEEPADVLRAALEAARDGDLSSMTAWYEPAAARDLSRAVAVAEGSGWVPARPLRLLATGEVEEVHRDGDLAVLEIRAAGPPVAICMTRGPMGWRITLDEAVFADRAWSCRAPRDPAPSLAGEVGHATE